MTPTAKELFLAAWQAQLSQVVPEPEYADAVENVDAEHSWQPFSVGTNTEHWMETWRHCVRIARLLARVEAEVK